MKHLVLIPIALITLCLMLALPASAQCPGKSYHGRQIDRNGNYGNIPARTHPMIDSSTPRTITGTVYETCGRGQGLWVDTGDETLTVFGVGPIRYWADAGIDRPTIGEEVVVNALETTFSNGNTRLIATDITIGGETLDLRDDSGYPLWRGGRGGMRWQQQEPEQQP